MQTCKDNEILYRLYFIRLCALILWQWLCVCVWGGWVFFVRNRFNSSPLFSHFNLLAKQLIRLSILERSRLRTQLASPAPLPLASSRLREGFWFLYLLEEPLAVGAQSKWGFGGREWSACGPVFRQCLRLRGGVALPPSGASHLAKQVSVKWNPVGSVSPRADLENFPPSISRCSGSRALSRGWWTENTADCPHLTRWEGEAGCWCIAHDMFMLNWWSICKEENLQIPQTERRFWVAGWSKDSKRSSSWAYFNCDAVVL